MNKAWLFHAKSFSGNGCEPRYSMYEQYFRLSISSTVTVVTILHFKLSGHVYV